MNETACHAAIAKPIQNFIDPIAANPHSHTRNPPMNSHALRRALALLTLTLGCASAPLLHAEVTENFQQSFPLPAGGTVSLENMNGKARIVGTDGSREVRITAVKTGRDDEDLKAVAIRVDASAGAVRITTDYHADGERRKNNRASVDYTLTVPRDARLDKIALTNGSLEIEGVHGGVHAACTNGGLSARDVAGSVQLSDVNGALSASLRSLTPGEPVKLNTVNGSLRLSLPNDPSATVRASTVNGRIENSFGLSATKNDVVGRQLEGTIGAGATPIELRTVNGSIAISRVE